jgi:thiamine kinase-like enzyme
MVLVLEDLSEHYPVIPDSIALDLVRVCISWLAEFHGRFLQQPVEDLWQIGCYWHLETRPDEFEKMEAGALKTHAHAIDAALNLAQFQTVVHGDAKLANFCFTSDGQAVAAVDFQYVGRGVGVKDLVYFFSSCLSEEETDLYETELLDHYFARLRQATLRHNLSVDPDKLEQEWRELYAFAWADFQRFLEGWSPGHWKLNASMDRHTQAALSLLVQRQDS